LIEYAPLLEGRPAIISFVTVAELRYGAKLAGWGTKRLRRLDHELARAEIVWPGPTLVDIYATLRASCVKNGPGLGQKDHKADRWIAAAARHSARCSSRHARCDLRQRGWPEADHQTVTRCEHRPLPRSADLCGEALDGGTHPAVQSRGIQVGHRLGLVT
jgi:hypothetical protein